MIVYGSDVSNLNLRDRKYQRHEFLFGFVIITSPYIYIYIYPSDFQK